MGEAMKAPLLLLLTGFVASSGASQVPLSLDTSFRCTRFATGMLLDNLPLANGGIIATGYNTYIDGCCNPENGPKTWLKFLSNGNIDESWPSGAGQGFIYPFGPYYYVSNTFQRYFQATGEHDTSWPNDDPWPAMLPGNMGNMTILPDGKIINVGNIWLQEQWGINAPSTYCLWRIEADGLVDSTYRWRKTDGIIWTIQPTTQGRFLLSGVYNTYEGLPEGRILRIWPDGGLDSTFHTSIIKGYAIPLVEQANGRIIAGGQFVFPNDPDTLHLIRLMPDGTLDTTFNNHAEYGRLGYTTLGDEVWFDDFWFSVGDVKPLADGTMLVAGNFTHIDGQLRRGIALLDSTGHLLNTALNGEGALLTHDFNSTFMYSQVNAIRLAPDGSIFLAGAFHGFDDGTVSDTSMTFICKLHGLSTGIPEHEASAWQVRLWPNPGTDVLHVEAGIRGRFDVRVLDATGRQVLAGSAQGGPLELSSAGLAQGVYVVAVNTTEGRRTVKWVKP
jgi:hypothetical protein